MILYIDNHKYHYEMENLCRAFLFTEEVAVLHEYTELSAPYVLTSVHDDVRVTLCTSTFNKTLSAPLGDDDELTMGQLLYQLLSQAYDCELPWGILTGVRPIKLYSRLCDRNGEEAARRYFSDTLYVSDEKIALAQQVRKNQQVILSRSDPSHWM